MSRFEGESFFVSLNSSKQNFADWNPKKNQSCWALKGGDEDMRLSGNREYWRINKKYWIFLQKDFTISTEAQIGYIHTHV